MVASSSYTMIRVYRLVKVVSSGFGDFDLFDYVWVTVTLARRRERQTHTHTERERERDSDLDLLDHIWVSVLEPFRQLGEPNIEQGDYTTRPTKHNKQQRTSGGRGPTCLRYRRVALARDLQGN
jgi:hypothetical protein